MIHYPLWIIFFLVVGLVLVLDLGLLHRHARPVQFREACYWSLCWFTLAMLFAVGVFILRGQGTGMEFLTGYIIEISLSVDNVFLFAVLFTYFQVPSEYQHRVLSWGVLSAVVMRGIMIATGAHLIERFHWIIYLFGGFLILTGIKMFLHRNDDPDPGDSKLILWLRRNIRLTEEYDGQKFFTFIEGRRFATPLFLVLVMIECTDLIFALDSIPAIFAITTDPFVVFTSNIFAIMGLRSLYFLLAGAMGLFHYLTIGLSVVLVFVGVKMLAGAWNFHIPIGYSLLVIVGVLGLSIFFSIRKARKEESVVAESLPPG